MRAIWVAMCTTSLLAEGNLCSSPLEIALCPASDGGSVGCVSKSMVDSDKTYPVEFRHDSSGDDPTICWKTCHTVYSNTSLALVALRQLGSLECHCAAAEAVRRETVGPDAFCRNKCNKTSAFCGGQHTFADGTTRQYFSIYCIPTIADGNKSAAIPRNGALNRAAAATVNESDDDLLQRIWTSLAKTSVLSIVMIGLLIILLMLLLILLAWSYLFAKNYESGAQSQFFRRLSEANKDGATTPNYGATNQAFDASPSTDNTNTMPEMAVAGEPMAAGERSTFYYGMNGEDRGSRESVDTEPAEEYSQINEKK